MGSLLLQMEPMGPNQGGSANPPIFLYGSGFTNVSSAVFTF